MSPFSRDFIQPFTQDFLHPLTGPSLGGLPVPTEYHWDADAPKSLYDSIGRTGAAGLSHGGLVASWGDGVAMGNGTSAQRPSYQTNVLNGKPVVRFDGTDDWLGAVLAPLVITTTRYSVFLVINSPAPVSGNGIFGAGINSGPLGAPYRTASGFSIAQETLGEVSLVRRVVNPAAAEITKTADARGGFRIVEFHAVNGFITPVLDGVAGAMTNGTPDVLDPDILRIGSSASFVDGSAESAWADVDVAEIIFYITVDPLTSTQKASIFNYLNRKWFPESPYVYMP